MDGPSSAKAMFLPYRSVFVCSALILLAVYLVIPLIGLPDQPSAGNSSRKAPRLARSTSGLRSGGLSARKVSSTFYGQRAWSNADLAKAHGFLVDSQSCRIPDYNPYNPVVNRTLEKATDSSTSLVDLIKVVDGQSIKLNESLRHRLGIKYCQWQSVKWSGDAPDGVHYDNAVNFTDDIKPEADSVRIRCYGDNATGIYTNVHPLVRRKEEVERRCDESLEKYVGAGKKSVDALYNVLMIGIESTSRLNSIRRLQQTRRLLSDQLQAVELRGYGRVGDSSLLNTMALLTGKLTTAGPSGSMLWRPFAEVGYRTLAADNSASPKNGAQRRMKGALSNSAWIRNSTDYSFRPTELIEQGERFCAKHSASITLDWTHDFVKMMNEEDKSGKRRPFFAYSFLSRRVGRIKESESTAWVDIALANFFGRLNSASLLANTVVVLFSDHGVRYGSTRGYTRMGWYEENTPMALIALPDSFRRRHADMFKSLQSNAGSLTTPMDLHETIRRLLTVGRPYDKLELSSPRRGGLSLLDGPIGDRSCEQASIAPVYCECLLSSTTALKNHSVEARHLALLTVRRMNDILANYLGACATLRLSRVLEARRTPGTRADQRTAFYTLTYQTSPGNAVFRAMAKRVSGNKSRNDRSPAIVDLHGDILRLDHRANASTSGCIRHNVYKHWCHCVKPSTDRLFDKSKRVKSAALL